MVVDVSTVAQGVNFCQGAGSGQDLTVGIVGVGGYDLLIAVHDVKHIALEIGHIVVGSTIVGLGIGVTAFVVEEVQGVGAVGLPYQLATGIEVIGGSGVAVMVLSLRLRLTANPPPSQREALVRREALGWGRGLRPHFCA